MHFEIQDDIRKTLFFKAKKNLGGNWNDLAYFLGVNRSMLFFYLAGRYRIPNKLLLKLTKLADFQIKNSQMKMHKKGKSITTPKISNELVEFLGTLSGDGHVNNITYEMTISGHRRLDRIYLVKFVTPLIQKLFGLNPYFVEKNNVMYCRVYSKRLVEFLHDGYNVPIGKKKGLLRVPPIFLTKKYAKHFLRGIFDTDGSINRHHKLSASLEITSVTPKFLEDLQKALKIYGFHPKLKGKALSLYRKKEVDMFFEVIKPRNQRHLRRYGIYKKIGYIPKEMRQ